MRAPTAHLLIALAAFSAPMAAPESAAQTAGRSCGPPGTWVTPQGRRVIPSPIPSVAPQSVVLLGEAHDSAEQHRWQLQTLAALHADHPDLVIGFEAFPRSAQPVLDDWVAGKLSTDAFLSATDWRRYWGYDSALYQPLFDFARMNRVPMVALNVGNDLIAKISRAGLAAVPEAEREGIDLPAPPETAYRDELQRIGRQHSGGGGIEAFIEAQTFWDRAFATALGAARNRLGSPLVVGVLGAGHVSHGYGVPHQLRALGIETVVAWMTWDAVDSCDEIPTDLADALFVIDEPLQPPAVPPLRLGVRLETAESGVRVVTVAAGSVGAAAGILPGDILESAAGKALGTPDDVVATIARQAPGTWLPMVARRQGEAIDLLAKFPANP
ncbi:MAG: ChaN family lipoprotein [Bauldia sp.]